MSRIQQIESIISSIIAWRRLKQLTFPDTQQRGIEAPQKAKDPASQIPPEGNLPLAPVPPVQKPSRNVQAAYLSNKLLTRPSSPSFSQPFLTPLTISSPGTNPSHSPFSASPLGRKRVRSFPTYSSPANIGIGLGVEDPDCPFRIFAFFFNFDIEPNNPSGSLSSEDPEPDSDSDSDSIRADSTFRLIGRLLGVLVDACGFDGLEGGCCFSLPFTEEPLTLGRSDVELEPFLYTDEVDAGRVADGVGLGGIGFLTITFRTTGPPVPETCFF
jgi:hypothetical protein